MENILIFSDRIYSSANKDIVKKVNLISLLISSFILLLGIFLFVFAWKQDDDSSTISMLLLTVGTILILWSSYRFIWNSRINVYLPTGSRTIQGSYFFDTNHADILCDMFNGKIQLGTSDIHFQNSGNIRLDYILSEDHKYAAVQLFKYIPYTYEPISNVYFLNGDDSELFAMCLSNKTI